MNVHYTDEAVTLWHGDCIEVMRQLPDASVDAVVTDPPYGLEFMGKEWDRPWAVSPTQGVGFAGREDNLTLPSFGDNRNANCRGCGGRQRGKKRCTCDVPDWDRKPGSDMAEFQAWCLTWTAELYRVLKPGGHLLAFGGTRTWHRLACAIEDAGFEVRDSIAWMYGSGFPKSLDVSKAIDKAARGVPQGAADPTSPNHGKYRTTTTEGKRWQGDSGQGYGAGGSRFLADGMASDSATERVASGAVEIVPSTKKWQGWGTALKPAFEPIVVARKPLIGTVAANVLAHGTGALNVDGARVGTDGGTKAANFVTKDDGRLVRWDEGHRGSRNEIEDIGKGRWPANVILDESQAEALDRQSGWSKSPPTDSVIKVKANDSIGTFKMPDRETPNGHGDAGGASRFFYTAKADSSERPRVDGVAHPTVKPLDLMRYLVRLVTPPGGVVLEPFAGSGTTLEACIVEGFRCIGIEREADYIPLIMARISKPIEVTLL